MSPAFLSPQGDLWIPTLGGVATKDMPRPRPLKAGEFGTDTPACLPPPPFLCTSTLFARRLGVDPGVAVGGWAGL